MPEKWIYHYKIISQLGQGGMGVVYRAWDSKLGREVALKLLLRSNSPVEMKRFQREAQVIARLRHSNIVTLYDIGEFKGHLYYTMELIEGSSLKEYLQSNDLSWQQKALLMKEICEALYYVHSEGIFHRDLKPGNILIDKGKVKIADFGLAKVADNAESLSQTGQVMGTLRYMAPEQAEGQHAQTSAETDVYALGVIFYELLTGKAPFQADSPRSLVAKIFTATPAHPVEISPLIPHDLAEITLRAMAKEKSDRYPTAQAMAEEINKCLSQTQDVTAPLHPSPVAKDDYQTTWQDAAHENLSQKPQSAPANQTSSRTLPGHRQRDKTKRRVEAAKQATKPQKSSSVVLPSLLVLAALGSIASLWAVFFSSPSSLPPKLLYQQQPIQTTSHFMKPEDSIVIQSPAGHFLYLIRKEGEQAWPESDFSLSPQAGGAQREVSPGDFLGNQSWFLVTSSSELSESDLIKISSNLGTGKRAVKAFVMPAASSPVSQEIQWQIYHLAPHTATSPKLLTTITVSDHPLHFSSWIKKSQQNKFQPLAPGGEVKEGDQLQLRLQAYRSNIHVVALLKDSKGKISQLFPLSKENSQKISSQSKQYIPHPKHGFAFDATIGQEVIVYFYDTQKLAIEQLKQWLKQQPLTQLLSSRKLMRGVEAYSGPSVAPTKYGTVMIEHK